MATARLSNLGYLMLSKETTPGTPVLPAIAVPLYDESMGTDANIIDINPADGTKFATYASLPGVRSHKGDVTVLFEANTAAHFFNSLLTQGTSTNSGGVFTYPFTLGSDSASYTWDVSLGNIVKRFYGVKASKINPSLNKNEWQAKVSVSALGSFDGRTVASITGTGPYVVTLDDTNAYFDGNPTKGLVVGDLIRFYDTATSAYVCDGTITVLTATQVTFTVNSGVTTAIGAGDIIQLRPQTPTYNNLQPFLWSKTRFCFGATASAALSATHTPVDNGSTWDIMHNFSEADGAQRSGSFDPASLDRTTGDIDLTIKKLTDTPEDLAAYKALTKSACVVRMYAGSTNQYECRITYNQLVMDTPLGNIKSGSLVMSTEKYHTNMNFTDGQAFDVKVLNALATV